RMNAAERKTKCCPTQFGVAWPVNRDVITKTARQHFERITRHRDFVLANVGHADTIQKFNGRTQPDNLGDRWRACFKLCRQLCALETVKSHFRNHVAAAQKWRHRFEQGDDITIHGPRNPELRGATFSFAFRGIHPHDLSQVLDQSNVCVRAGHHCAKPLMKIIGANATARASFYLYNTTQDADALADALDSASDIF
ncbi:MAG: aminotransferase class V-fold PLP-dependent enzyme, partial [Acidimicrobiia bacterium]|nr:aminotransferase class V-fold PLP-dependent enzyme [Acidimicrobiia bacterium]